MIIIVNTNNNRENTNNTNNIEGDNSLKIARELVTFHFLPLF